MKNPLGFHQDSGRVNIELEFSPRPLLSLKVGFWLSDVSEEGRGNFYIVPGSHLWEKERQPFEDEVIQAEMPAGSLLIYLGGIWHGGGQNQSNTPRMGLALQYSAGWLRQEENQYLSNPPEVARTFSEPLQRLLGYDFGGPFLGFVNGADPKLILDNEAKQEDERKAKQYWDDYYAKHYQKDKWATTDDFKETSADWGASADGSTMFSEDFENLDQRDLRTNDRDDQWHVKQDNDGNAIYCNKSTNHWTDFNFGSENWSDYSISYKIKLSTKKPGTLETHIRKHSGGGAQYRAINKIQGRAAIEFAHPDERVNQGIASGARATIGDKWSDIQLIASGNSIEYLVNGKVVASTNDDRVKKGAAMIAASANLEVCIDNIVVKKETTKVESSQ